MNRNQSNVASPSRSPRIRLAAAQNTTDCDCSYHSKKNRSAGKTRDGVEDDGDDESDTDEA